MIDLRKFTIPLTLLLTSLLIGCGNTETKTQDTTDSTSTETNISVEKNDEENNASLDTTVKDSLAYWEEKEIERPKVLPLTQRETLKYPEQETSSMIPLYKNPYDWNYEDMIEKVKNDEFCKNTFVFATEEYESLDLENYETIGTKAYGKYEKILKGDFKNQADDNPQYYYDFKLTLASRTNLYDNFSSFRIQFDGIENSKEYQKQITPVLTELVGEEFANYLIYAKDNDGIKYTYDGHERDIEIGQLYENIVTDLGTYTFQRYVTEDTLSMSIIIDDSSIYTYKNDGYFFNEYTSIYNDFDYKISSLFTNTSLGKVEGESSYDLFADYFKSLDNSYRYTLPKEASFYRTVADNGTISEKAHIEFTGSFEENNGMTFELDYTILAKDGSIIDSEIEMLGDTGYYNASQETEADKSAAYSHLFTIMKERLNVLFPGIDVSTMEKDVIELLSIEYDFNHLPYKTTVSMDAGTTMAGPYRGEFTVTLEQIDEIVEETVEEETMIEETKEETVEIEENTISSDETIIE